MAHRYRHACRKHTRSFPTTARLFCMRHQMWKHLPVRTCTGNPGRRCQRHLGVLQAVCTFCCCYCCCCCWFCRRCFVCYRCFFLSLSLSSLLLLLLLYETWISVHAPFSRACGNVKKYNVCECACMCWGKVRMHACWQSGWPITYRGPGFLMRRPSMYSIW